MSTFIQIDKDKWDARWVGLAKGLGYEPDEVFSMNLHRSGVVEITTMEDLCNLLPKT